MALTVYTTAQAVLQRAKGDYKVTVYVDGLRKGSEVREFTHGVRRLHIRVKKVRGGREQSDPLLRLADAMAGFIRDALEGHAYAQDLYRRAIAQGMIQEL